MEPTVPVLFAYYVCNAIAEERLMTPAEARACAATYEAVKIAHLTSDERADLTAGPAARARALRTGYNRYMAWTEANPEMVAALRAAAARPRLAEAS